MSKNEQVTEYGLKNPKSAISVHFAGKKIEKPR
jgi:hypothetical protein